MGQRVRARRKELGLSQEQLAVKAGVSYPTIGRIERNAHFAAQFPTVLALAKALDVTVDYLTKDDPTPGNKKAG